MKYEEWLALSDEARDQVHREQWNVYDRVGYLIAMEAALRLAKTCGFDVLDISVGTFHGGEYVLHLSVPDALLQTLPSLLEQRFEGFRVAWLPASRLGMFPPAKDHLGGTWRHVDEDTDVEFTFDVGTVPPTVGARCISDGEQLVVTNVVANDQWLLFTTITPSTGHVVEQIVSATEPGMASVRLTFTETWKRIED